MIRRAFLAAAAAFLLRGDAADASGTCPERGGFVEPMPRSNRELALKYMLVRLQSGYRGRRGLVYAPAPLHPPGGAIKLGGTVYRFMEPPPGAMYFFRVVNDCEGEAV